jgi:hypothetical protein
MGIDGVGKPGGIGPLGGAPGASSADPTSGASFKSELEGVAAGARTDPSGPLSRLERGELSLQQYLDLRVEDATLHLQGRLDPEQLEFVKEALRQQLETDPVLLELVRRTTGSTAPDNER